MPGVVFDGPDDFYKTRRAVNIVLASQGPRADAGRGEETARSGEVFLVVNGPADLAGVYPCASVVPALEEYGRFKEQNDGVASGAAGFVTPPYPATPSLPATGDWTTLNGAETGRVFDLNDRVLEVGTRVKGTVVGTYEGYPLYVCDHFGGADIYLGVVVEVLPGGGGSGSCPAGSGSGGVQVYTVSRLYRDPCTDDLAPRDPPDEYQDVVSPLPLSVGETVEFWPDPAFPGGYLAHPLAEGPYVGRVTVRLDGETCEGGVTVAYRYTVTRLFQCDGEGDQFKPSVPPLLYRRVRSPVQMEVGQFVEFWPDPERPGEYIAHPLGGGGGSSTTCSSERIARFLGLKRELLQATILQVDTFGQESPGGLCASIDAGQVVTLRPDGAGDPATTWTGGPFVTDGLTGDLVFTKPNGIVNPKLELVGNTTYTFWYIGCQNGKLAFAGANEPVCEGDDGQACNNQFVVLIDCAETCDNLTCDSDVILTAELTGVTVGPSGSFEGTAGFNGSYPMAYTGGPGEVSPFTNGWEYEADGGTDDRVVLCQADANPVKARLGCVANPPPDGFEVGDLVLTFGTVTGDIYATYVPVGTAVDCAGCVPFKLYDADTDPDCFRTWPETIDVCGSTPLLMAMMASAPPRVARRESPRPGRGRSGCCGGNAETLRPQRATAPAVRKEAPPAPCRHLGDDVSGPERQRLGLPHTQKWAACGHPDRASLVPGSVGRKLKELALLHATGSPVCPCAGCGVRCPGYAAGEPE